MINKYVPWLVESICIQSLYRGNGVVSAAATTAADIFVSTQVKVNTPWWGQAHLQTLHTYLIMDYQIGFMIPVKKGDMYN